LKATVGRLLDYDRKRNCSLAETILCYLDSSHNARRTAAKLGIHVNTLRQRFETIDRLLEGWSDTPKALEIHLALRLWQLRGGRHGSAGLLLAHTSRAEGGAIPTLFCLTAPPKS